MIHHLYFELCATSGAHSASHTRSLALACYGSWGVSPCACRWVNNWVAVWCGHCISWVWPGGRKLPAWRLQTGFINALSASFSWSPCSQWYFGGHQWWWSSMLTGWRVHFQGTPQRVGFLLELTQQLLSRTQVPETAATRAAACAEAIAREAEAVLLQLKSLKTTFIFFINFKCQDCCLPVPFHRSPWFHDFLREMEGKLPGPLSPLRCPGVASTGRRLGRNLWCIGAAATWVQDGRSHGSQWASNMQFFFFWGGFGRRETEFEPQRRFWFQKSWKKQVQTNLKSFEGQLVCFLFVRLVKRHPSRWCSVYCLSLISQDFQIDRHGDFAISVFGFFAIAFCMLLMNLSHLPTFQEYGFVHCQCWARPSVASGGSSQILSADFLALHHLSFNKV